MSTLIPAFLTPLGRAWLLGFELRSTLAPEAVFAAAATPEALSTWFPCHVSGSFTAGGELSFRFEGASREEDLVLPGTLVSLDAIDGGAVPDRWAIDWAGDLLTLAVSDAPGGGSLARFSARIDQLGRAARDAAGWHVNLAALARELGDPAAPGNAEWQPLFASYAQAFGPDAATELPPGR